MFQITISIIYFDISGTFLFLLYIALIRAAQKKFVSGLITKKEFKEVLENYINLLYSSMEIVSFENPSTLGGQIAKNIPIRIEFVKKVGMKCRHIRK